MRIELLELECPESYEALLLAIEELGYVSATREEFSASGILPPAGTSVYCLASKEKPAAPDNGVGDWDACARFAVKKKPRQPYAESIWSHMAADQLASRLQETINTGLTADTHPRCFTGGAPLVEAFKAYLLATQDGTKGPEALTKAADRLAYEVNEAVQSNDLDARSGPADAALAYASNRFGDDEPVFALQAYVEFYKA